MQRTFITLLILVAAVSLLIIFSTGNSGTGTAPTDTTAPNTAPGSNATAPDEAKTGDDAAQQVDGNTAVAQDNTPAPAASDPSDNTDIAAPAADASATPKTIVKLPAMVAVGGDEVAAVSIGDHADIPDDAYRMKVTFTQWGAAIKQIELAHYSNVVYEHDPYIVQRYIDDMPGIKGSVYPMAARLVTINGQRVSLSGVRWELVDQSANDNEQSATFAVTIRTQEEQPRDVLRVTRTYRLVLGRYDVQLDQAMENLLGEPLEVRFSQLAQTDMPSKASYMGDRRTLLMGYHNPEYDAARSIVFTEGFNPTRQQVIDDAADAAENRQAAPALWPTDTSVEEKYELVWAAMSNRYFTTAIYAPPTKVSAVDEPGWRPARLDEGMATLRPIVQTGEDSEDDRIVLVVDSAPLSLANKADTASFNLHLYAGPKAPDVIDADPQYQALGLHEVIVYNLGGCCTFLTFSWLAEGLLGFLKLLQSFLFDWGVAIIILVIVVRLVLHPLTKKSQIQMMKFGKQMQKLNPEIQKIKEKYKDDSSKQQAEMMKLYKEKGVNPAAMGLGCLPMFLQMPIWIALYAMLFFAIELRHQPAFFDVFHTIGEAIGVQWNFLSDLSTSDNFLPLPVDIPFIGDSFNILPICMALVFFFQQKFMSSAQSTATMTDQQRQQQAMMKWMMPILFPIMLYQAPSGLTLYMVASSLAGILDSYFVRKHLKDQEESGELFKPKTPKKGGFMERMQQAALERQKQLEQQKKRVENKRKGKKGPRKP